MKKFITISLCILLVIPSLTACKSTSKIENTFGFTEPIESIVGSTGAVVGDLSKDRISLDISENALSSEQRIIVGVVDEFKPPDKDKGTLLSTPVSLSVDQTLKRFDGPITVKMGLTDEEVKEIQKEDEIWGAYYNGKYWEFIKPTTIDYENKYIAFETYHFSWFSKAKPTKDEILKDFAEGKAIEIWNNNSNNNVTEQETKSLIKEVLKNQLGVTDNPTLVEDILVAMMKEDAYVNLLNDYAEGNMEAYSQTVALMAGEKIVDVISNYPPKVSGQILGGVLEHASKIGTGVQMATYLANGQYTDAMKSLSTEIMGNYPLVAIFTTAAEITERQIARWKDQELESAYQVFNNGVESDVPFWGYSVEKGDFDSLWNQMRGIQTKVLDDAIKDYAARNGVDYNSLGSAVLDNIRKEAKENLRQEFIKRQSEEKEIAKIQAENMKLIEAYNNANLLEKYRFGFTEDTSLEFRLERLFRLKEMILNDTKARVTNNDLPEKGEISPSTIALLTSIWYTGEDGKDEYRKKLIELGYLEEEPQVYMELVYNGIPTQPDYIPQHDYEAIGWMLDNIEIGKDGIISQSYGGGKSLKLQESWITHTNGPGATITLIDASLQGKFNEKIGKGEGILKMSWKFTEEGGAGMDYEKYNILRTFDAKVVIEKAYSEPNKSRGQMYVSTYGNSVWEITYTGKMFDAEKREEYIGTETSTETNTEWGGNNAFDVIKN